MTYDLLDEQITPIGNGHLLIESWTHPGEHHAVDTKEMTCSCPGFRCLRRCRHLQKVKRLLKIMEAQNGASGSANPERERLQAGEPL